jgi:hypothetical protein
VSRWTGSGFGGSLPAPFRKSKNPISISLVLC